MPTTTHPALCPPHVPVKDRIAAAEQSRENFPGNFPTFEAARQFLFNTILPPSMKWAFKPASKSASSSTMHFLFQAEFGHKLTTRVDPLDDINPSASAHMVTDHNIFTRALWKGMSAADITAPSGPPVRICVVRDPVARALSGYRYLCKSHKLRSRWFARDRFRLDAMFGFDWDTHVDTLSGFHRFLEYIAWEIETAGADTVDAHWRPQTVFIKPLVYRPTLIGRMEDMDTYWKTLSNVLEVPLASQGVWANRQADTAPDVLAQDNKALSMIESIYSVDYQSFGY